MARKTVAGLDPERPLFLFVNVPALHQPNWFYLGGARRDDSLPAKGDTRASHAAALEYVDRHIGDLFAVRPNADPVSRSSVPTTGRSTARTG